MKAWFEGKAAKAGLFYFLDPVSWHGVTAGCKGRHSFAHVARHMVRVVRLEHLFWLDTGTCALRTYASMASMIYHRHPVPRHGVQPFKPAQQ